MIFLFTDFGRDGPYLGQMHAVLVRGAPGVPVIDLFHDVPAFDARGAAYLLAAYARDVAPGDVVVAVVDPGVGTERAPLVVEADGRWFVGPDNGLLAVVAARAKAVAVWRIGWRPDALSATFHGRDLFAPVAARLAIHGTAADLLLSPAPRHHGQDWPTDLQAVIYLDRYGNAVTGQRAADVDPGLVLNIGGYRIGHARTFGAAAPGQAFWYENSNGLLEIAVNQGNAGQHLGVSIGSPIMIAST